MQSHTRTDTNRELFGQGAANTVSGMLGGLPVTGVIVRSSANVAAGARTRLSTVLHGVWVAVAAIALVVVVEQVPLAALAGLLVVVGAQLVKPVDIRSARTHGELLVYVVTVAGVLLTNLLEGVAAGLAVAGVLMLRKAVRAAVRLETPEVGPMRVVIGGTLSFLSIPVLARVLAAVPAGAAVQLVLVVDYLDHAAFDHLDNWVRRHRGTGARVRVMEPGEQAPDGPRGRFATWEQRRGDASTPSAAVLAGAAASHRDGATVRERLGQLAGAQSPSGLLPTCADSRAVPNMITAGGPGDLFTVQNVGNPASGDDALAALRYAIDVLDVPLVAVCGHSGCGAVRTLLDGGDHGGDDGDHGGDHGGAPAEVRPGAGPSLAALPAADPVTRAALADGRSEADALAMTTVAVQLEALRARGVGTELMGLFLDISSASVLVLDGNRFVPVEEVT